MDSSIHIACTSLAPLQIVTSGLNQDRNSFRSSSLSTATNATSWDFFEGKRRHYNRAEYIHSANKKGLALLTWPRGQPTRPAVRQTKHYIDYLFLFSSSFMLLVGHCVIAASKGTTSLLPHTLFTFIPASSPAQIYLLQIWQFLATFPSKVASDSHSPSFPPHNFRCPLTYPTSSAHSLHLTPLFQCPRSPSSYSYFY